MNTGLSAGLLELFPLGLTPAIRPAYVLTTTLNP